MASNPQAVRTDRGTPAFTPAFNGFANSPDLQNSFSFITSLGAIVDFKGNVSCKNCLCDRPAKDMWWCRECAVAVCCACNLMHGHTNHRCAPWSPKEIALTLARGLSLSYPFPMQPPYGLHYRCQQRIEEANESKQKVHQYVVGLEQCLVQRINQRLNQSNEADTHVLGCLVNEFKIDGFSLDTSGFQRGYYQRYAKSAGGSSFLQNTCGSALSHSCAFTGADVNSTIDQTLQELVKLSPNASTEAIANVSVESRRSNQSSCSTAPVFGVNSASMVEVAKAVEDQLLRVPSAGSPHASDVKIRPPALSYNLLDDVNGNSFRRSDMLSTSTPIGTSPLSVKKVLQDVSGATAVCGHSEQRSAPMVRTMQAPTSDWENPFDRFHDTNELPAGRVASAKSSPSKEERVVASSVKSDTSLAASTVPTENLSNRSRAISASDNVPVIMDKFSRAASSCGDYTDGAQLAVDMSGSVVNRTASSSYAFGSEYLTRPIDVVMVLLSNDPDQACLAVSDSCGGVYICDVNGNVVKTIWTEGDSASSLCYSEARSELYVSIMRRDQRRVVHIYDIRRDFELQHVHSCPSAPMIDIARTRWIAVTSTGELYLVSGDNSLGALWRLAPNENTWFTIKTQKKARYQYVCLIENHPAEGTTVVITADGVSGCLCVFYILPNGRVSAEYNLSELWDLTTSIKNPASAVYDEYGNLLILDYATGRVWLLYSVDSPQSAAVIASSPFGSRRSSFTRSSGKRRSFRLLRSKSKSSVNSGEATSERQLRIIFEVGPQSGIGLATKRGWCYVAVFARKRIIAFKYLEV